jgi:hypothetical protein
MKSRALKGSHILFGVALLPVFLSKELLETLKDRHGFILTNRKLKWEATLKFSQFQDKRKIF